MSSFTVGEDRPLEEVYATLSHTWGEEEVTFQNFHRSDRHSNKGFRKILGCCEQAKKDGIGWVWIDTCCIDKTNSAELSEAINSMYAWYLGSAVCYVFLEDVPPRTPYFPEECFRKARWFTRGWCLQELIAPPRVEFYARDWSDIGTKWGLHKTIKSITGIPAEVLLKKRHLKVYPVAEKMSWASKRTTSRVEDEAYCLLGIFDVHMPLIYGEGLKAFQRLQIEILGQKEDYSILLWTGCDSRIPGVLAPTPFSFPKDGLLSSTRQKCLYEDFDPFYDSDLELPGGISQALASRNPPQLTGRGLRVQMFVNKRLGSDLNHLFVEGRLSFQQSSSLFGSHYLLLWTEYAYDDKYVCIALVENKIGGIYKTYARGFDDELFLVDRRAFEKFELMELYLATHSIRWGADLTQLPQEPLDLDILLSSKPETSTSFVQSSPPIPFRSTGPTTYNLHPVPRLYYPGGKLDVIKDSNRVLMKFDLFPNRSEVRAASFMATLWLDLWSPRCFVAPCSNSSTSDLDDPAPNRSLQDDLNDVQYHKSSDTASCELPNCCNVITAMVKVCRGPRTFSEASGQWNPAYFKLLVTDLGNGNDSPIVPPNELQI
ncbi:Fc.00g053090.m01.CDS01 [Cosmosporella sp. VM-42]